FLCASATKLCEAALSLFPSRLFANSLSVLSISLSLLSTPSICCDVLAEGCEVAARSIRFVSSSSMIFRSEEHTSELQSRFELVCRLLLEKKKQMNNVKSIHCTVTAKETHLNTLQ